MNPSDHPLMKQIQQDVAQANQAEEQARQLDQMEARRLRQEQGQYLARQYALQVEEYEQQRQALHRQIGAVWTAAQAYARLTGQNPSTFPEAIFSDIHIPTLGPEAYHLSPGFTTTRASILAWFASTGKEWK